MLRTGLFVVRIWKEGRGRTGFRASVRAVDAERGRVFTRPGDMARYFADDSVNGDKPPMKPRYTVERLVSDLRRARDQAAGSDDLIERVRAIARRAVAAQQDWLNADMCRPDAEQGFGFRLLHEEADHALAVFVASWLPGRGTPPHDHGTWAVVAGPRGSERDVQWHRLDEGTRRGYARIVVAEERPVGAGDVIAMRPGAIHSVRNDGDTISVSLHIYGRHVNYTGRSQFDPRAHREMPYRVATSGGIAIPAKEAP